MKSRILILCVAISVMFLPLKASAATLTLTTAGVTMSMSDLVLRPVPDMGTIVTLDFSNNAGSVIVDVKYEITDKTGAVFFSQGAPVLAFGSKARITSTYYDSQFKNAVEPLVITLLVEYIDAGASKTTRRVAQVNSPFKFTERPIPSASVPAAPKPTAAPVPTPTVTVTSSALQFENYSLKQDLVKVNKEVQQLKAKITQICKVKPKPKGC